MGLSPLRNRGFIWGHRLLLAGGVLAASLFSILFVATPKAEAAAGINQQMNFQGRLYTNLGNTVPDGYYNIQFNIYQDGTGQAVGNPGGTLKWTENWLNANTQGVMVKNGFLSVQLGSINPFANQVDWNQDTLWLSMNIAGTGPTCTPFAACSPDGEMVPMKRMSATAYALNAQNANTLNGLNAAGFVQNTTSASLQTSTSLAIQSAADSNETAYLQGRTSQTAATLSIKQGASQTGLAIKVVNNNDDSLLTLSSAGELAVSGDSTFSAKLGIGSAVVANVRLAVVAGSGNTGLQVDGNGTQDIANFRNGSTSVATIGNNGQATLQNSADSTSALNVKKSAGTGGGSVFNVDTTNGRVGINDDTPGYALDVNGSVNVTTGNSYKINGTDICTASGCTPASGSSYYIQNTTTPQTANIAIMSANTGGVTDISLLIKQAASQTGDLLRITDNSNVQLGNFDQFGNFNATGTITASNGLRGDVNAAGTSAAIIRQLAASATAPTMIIKGGATPTSTADLLQLQDSNSDRVAGFNKDGQLYLGRASGATGSMQFANSTNANTVTIQSGVTTTGYTLTLPTALGNSGDCLKDTNGSGTLGFVTCSNGVTTVGSFSATSIANGASISGTTITFGPADATNPGMVSLTTQTFAGDKTFSGTITGGTITGAAATLLTVQGGAATSGNTNGGNLLLTGGAGFGTGVNGLVVIGTPTFSTALTDANCYAGGVLATTSCTISSASVNGSAGVIVGFSQIGQTATLPDPAITTAGRIIYVTAANGSSDFSLSVNGGGTGNVIAMRQNTSATMVWNGTDWTAAGASSSTTLQSAYDNTLQTAGGAELVVSKTSTTNGLTIRDSSTSPVNGTLLSIQTSSTAVLLSVNSNVTEYASNAGAETAGSSSSTFAAGNWSTGGSATVSRYTTAGNYIATGQASVAVTTTTAANDGVKNALTTTLTSNTTYNVSFTARLASGTFTDMNVYYSIDGTAASVACKTGQAIATSVWTKVNCAFAAPSSGITSSNAILIRQTGSGTARTFYVDNLSVTIAADYNYATDGTVANSGSFATNWSSVSGATVTRSTTVGNDASDSAEVVTTGSGQGVRNKLSINPLQGTLYRVTAYAASTTSGFSTFTARYSRDAGTNFVNCADYNTQTISSSTTDFTKITCYITTDSTTATDPYLYFTQTDATGRTFYVDTFSMTLAGSTTPNVQIGGGINGGPTTLFTLDKGASAPIASNNEALLGSMYYDTTLGKLQCYEADGWGACGSSPDHIVTISPEYTNAVMHGTGVGTMTSDLCSDTLNINDGSSGQSTICGTNETYNFYKWTSPQATAQTYSIYVTYQLPNTFKSFLSGQASLMGRTDSTNSTVRYQIYRQTTDSGLIACGSTVAVSTGAAASWQTGTASGAADPSTCGFTPGSSIVFKIEVIASQNANAYVGNLNFAFNNN